MNFLRRRKYLSPPEIHFQISEGKHRFERSSSWSGDMTKCGTHPREQLIDAERLGDIVVGTQVKCGDLRLFLLASRQYKDRDSGPLAGFSNHFSPIRIG